jgi:hypothetical protein
MHFVPAFIGWPFTLGAAPTCCEFAAKLKKSAALHLFHHYNSGVFIQ